MKYNLAATVTLYNPAEVVIENIESYLEYINLLVIVDNSDYTNIEITEFAFKHPKIQIISNYKNKGIATALNQGIQYASKQGFEWIMTMDQDSSFEQEMIEKFLLLFNKYKIQKNIAIMGPVYGSDIKTYNTNETTKINALITSGSILNVSIYNTLEGFNELLFIDGVDYDYCFRARLSGYDIIQFNNIFMNHNLGDIVEVRNFFTGKFKQKSLHSPVRIYYFVRNYVYLIKKYRSRFPQEVRIKDLLVRIKNNLLYGKNKTDILKSVLKGWIDFKRKRFGPK